jgi:hypothetical protein
MKPALPTALSQEGSMEKVGSPVKVDGEGGPKRGQVCRTANARLARLKSLILHKRLRAEPTGLRLLFDESQQNDAN